MRFFGAFSKWLPFDPSEEMPNLVCDVAIVCVSRLSGFRLA